MALKVHQPTWYVIHESEDNPMNVQEMQCKPWPLTKEGGKAAEEAENRHGGTLITAKDQRDRELGYLVVLPGGAKIGSEGNVVSD